MMPLRRRTISPLFNLSWRPTSSRFKRNRTSRAVEFITSIPELWQQNFNNANYKIFKVKPLLHFWDLKPRFAMVIIKVEGEPKKVLEPQLEECYSWTSKTIDINTNPVFGGCSPTCPSAGCHSSIRALVQPAEWGQLRANEDRNGGFHGRESYSPTEPVKSRQSHSIKIKKRDGVCYLIEYNNQEWARDMSK